MLYYCRYARCTRSVSIGKLSLARILVFECMHTNADAQSCFFFFPTIFYAMLCEVSVVCCSSPSILCPPCSIPSSFLYGARNIRQWFNDQWNYWTWRHGWRGRCKEHTWTWSWCCCQTPSCPQGECQAGYVLLLGLPFHEIRIRHLP